MITRRSLQAISAATLLARPALAQGTGAWPNRAIRLVVPLPPGGVADIAGRLQAQILTEGLGVPVVVDNRAGAGGTLGTAFVAQSAPDGYTVMNASPSTHLGAPQLFRNAGYEGVDDFTAIATFISGTSLVAVHPSLPVHSIADLIAYARANPGRINYGSAGAGGSNHMLGVLFMQLTGTEFTHVPYRGGAPALADLIAGNIQLVFDGYAALISTVRAGQIRALAVTSPTRWPLAPEYPTLEELGVAGFDLPSFNALMGPRGMPDAIVQRMNAVINEGLRDPRMVERLAAIGSIPFPSTPEEFATLMRTQRQRWQTLVRSVGLQPE